MLSNAQFGNPNENQWGNAQPTQLQDDPWHSPRQGKLFDYSAQETATPPQPVSPQTTGTLWKTPTQPSRATLLSPTTAPTSGSSTLL